MKKQLIYTSFFILSMMAYSCSPKTGEAVTVPDKAASPEVASDEFRSSQPTPGEARPIELGTYETVELDNGLKVIVVENHKTPRISYQLFVDRDPIFEGEQVGYISMAGQLLSTGTSSKTKAEIDSEVDFVGANLSTNSIGGFVSSLTKHSDKMLELFADVILNPSFPEDEFEKLKNQTLSNLAASQDDPNSISSDVSTVVNYGLDHVYGEIQTKESIESITLESCKEYYTNYFKPNISYLVVVGDISLENAKDAAEKYFGRWAKGDVPSHEFGKVEPIAETTVDFVDKTGAVQSVVNITYPVDLKPGTEDIVPASLMNNILGYGGFSGRLFQNLREDKGYTYGAYSSLNSDQYLGSFSASASVRNEVTDSAVIAFLDEMNRIRDEKVQEDELQLTKNLVFGQFARAMESPQTVATFALNTIRYGLPQDYYKNYLAKVDAVTAEDIQRVARKYIRPDQAHIVVVGSQDDVVEPLSKIAPVRFFDRYGNAIEMGDQEPIDADPAEVVKKYLQAIGGSDLLSAVKATYFKMSANTPMGALSMSQYSLDNKKFKMTVEAQGMTVQEQIFDGEKMKVSAMGQDQVVSDEASLKQAREQATPFRELAYFDDGYQLEIKGTEKVGDEEAYKVLVITDKGDKRTEFYGVESGLKLKEVATTDANGQSMTQVMEYANYQAIDGIKVPHKITISGMMPQPLTFELQEGSFNAEISDGDFNIE